MFCIQLPSAGCVAGKHKPALTPSLQVFYYRDARHQFRAKSRGFEASHGSIVTNSQVSSRPASRVTTMPLWHVVFSCRPRPRR
jgi:hypothetical protein